MYKTGPQVLIFMVTMRKKNRCFSFLYIVLFANYFQGKIRLLEYKELISLNQNMVLDVQRN